MKKLGMRMWIGVLLALAIDGAALGQTPSPSGKPTGELSKAYTFNLQELKQPIIEAVTVSGWTWQPVMWDAPKRLRWLTE